MPSPAPKPSDKGGVKEWIKKHLQGLGRALANLAGKAAEALPGIIGSIVSWLLSTLGKSAIWLADNVWALVIGVGTLLFVAATDWLSQRQPKRHLADPDPCGYESRFLFFVAAAADACCCGATVAGVGGDPAGLPLSGPL